MYIKGKPKPSKTKAFLFSIKKKSLRAYKRNRKEMVSKSEEKPEARTEDPPF